MSDMTDTRIVLRVHESYRRAVKVLAAQRGVTMAELVRQLIDAEFKRLR